MVTYIPPEIDWSTFPESDGEPMAENESNRIQMTDLIASLWDVLTPLERVHVGGNQIIYYDPTNGRNHVVPDVYVVLDVERRRRERYWTWREGKFPDVVFEISSESTIDVDLGHKRELYARLGAREYYIYDPLHDLSPPFQAYFLLGTRLERQPLLASGSIWSPALGVELRPVGIWLRIVEPATGRLVPEENLAERRCMEAALTEAIAARDAAEQQAQQAQAEARQAQEAAQQARDEARRSQEEAEREHRARLAAEAQARHAEEEAEALRQALRHARGDPGTAQ